MDLDSVLGTLNLPTISALFLGLITTVSPCPWSAGNRYQPRLKSHWTINETWRLEVWKY